MKYDDMFTDLAGGLDCPECGEKMKFNPNEGVYKCFKCGYMIDHDDTYTDIPDYAGECPDCPECGETMGYSYVKSEFKCPACGYIMDESDWKYEEDDGEIPWGCKVCGGPYPQCKISCKQFDD